jgi:tRNA threonylcarbamoyladenosine modification (KEOPS) complex Cgi121 subunit
MRKLEEFNNYIFITGFKNVQIKNVDNFLNLIREKLKREDVTVQFFDARHVAGWQHLYFASLNALTAFKNKENISNNLSVEILLYASAQRQIKHAVNLLGIKLETKEVAVVLLSQTQEAIQKAFETIVQMGFGEPDETVLDLDNQKFEGIMKLFGISGLEFNAKLERKGLEKEALTDLVIEHMALLATER